MGKNHEVNGDLILKYELIQFVKVNYTWITCYCIMVHECYSCEYSLIWEQKIYIFWLFLTTYYKIWQLIWAFKHGQLKLFIVFIIMDRVGIAKLRLYIFLKLMHILGHNLNVK